jgi:hypothetical protein
MWAHVCIILHNLIVHIKGDNFDNEWREYLWREGLGDADANVDVGGDNGLEDTLGQAQR